MNRCFRRALLACGALVSSACATTLTEQPRAPVATDLATLEATVREDSTDVEAVTWLAAGYAAADRIDEARTLLTRSMARGPRDESVLLMLALAEGELGQLGVAGTLHRSYLSRSTGPFRPLASSHLERLAPALTLADVERLAAEGRLPVRAPNRGRVAVLPFVGEPAEARRALRWMIEEELDAAGFDVVDPGMVGALVAVGDASPRATELAVALDVMRSTGAGVVVQGSALVEAAGDIRLDVHVVMLVSEGAYEVSSLPAIGALDELLAAPARLAPAIRSLSRDQPVDVGAAVTSTAAPSTAEALTAFGRGLRASEADDWRAAAREFERAEQLDPDFEPARQWRIRSEAIVTTMEAPLGETFAAIARAGQLQRSVAALRGSGGAVGTDRRSPVSDLLELDRLGVSLPLELVFEVEP